MREKLETLSLIQLREIAKSNGMKRVTTYRKPELIEKLVELSSQQQEASAVNSNELPEKHPETASDTLPETSSDTLPKTSTDAPAKTLSGPSPQEASQQLRGGKAEGPQQEDTFEPASRPYTPSARAYSQDSSHYPKKRAFTGIRSSRSRISGSARPAQPRDNAPSSGSGGYVRRNGGYTQSYNPVTPESPRPVKNTCRPQEEAPIQPAAPYAPELASDEPAHGILELNPEGFGFLRSENYLTGDNDVYVSPAQIRKFNMKTGDMIEGVRRVKSGSEKFAALLYVNKINGFAPSMAEHRPSFEDLTPVFPDSKLSLETPGGPVSLRILDLLSPIGKGQRGMIVSPPKAGKTTLLKDIAKAITANYPQIRLIVLLIDERPEEVTDIKECIEGANVEVIYSTFDEQPEHHKRVAEMVLERAKRLVEHGQDVMILLDSITRLARAYNLTVTPSGRTLSGGLDPAALHMPKKFFGAARNMREGGSLTILASALVDTGSRMDDVVFEEFKGTGNMELVLDRKLSERRIFPAIDICRSGTRREDLLLTPEEQEAVNLIRRHTGSARQEDAAERILDHFARTKNNQEFVESISKIRFS